MEKRSESTENAQHLGTERRVGGWHSPSLTTHQGGGYLNNYNAFKPIDGEKIDRDPRLNELREMGLRIEWQNVAQEIGFDNFLKMWQILDSQESLHHESKGLCLSLRRFRSYQRFQRDRYIQSLSKNGSTKFNIKKSVLCGLCESVSNRQISNALNKV